MHRLLHLRGVQCLAPEPLGTRDIVIGGGRILAIGVDLDPRGLGVDVDVDDYAYGLSVPAPRSHPVPQAPGPASALPCLLLDGPRPVVRNRPQDEWAPAQVPRFPGSPSVG